MSRKSCCIVEIEKSPLLLTENYLFTAFCVIDLLSGPLLGLVWPASVLVWGCVARKVSK